MRSHVDFALDVLRLAFATRLSAQADAGTSTPRVARRSCRGLLAQAARQPRSGPATRGGGTDCRRAPLQKLGRAVPQPVRGDAAPFVLAAVSDISAIRRASSAIRISRRAAVH
jgi:hypothetical protein